MMGELCGKIESLENFVTDRQNVIKGEYHSPKAVHSPTESCSIHYYFVTYYFDL